MSETDCPDCMALGQQLEAAQLEIQRLRRDLDETLRRHGEEVAAMERDFRDELYEAEDRGRWEERERQNEF